MLGGKDDTKVEFDATGCNRCRHCWRWCPPWTLLTPCLGASPISREQRVPASVFTISAFCLSVLVVVFAVARKPFRLHCSTWDLELQLTDFQLRHLVPWPGINPRPLAFRAQSLSHWTTGEVPTWVSLAPQARPAPTWAVVPEKQALLSTQSSPGGSVVSYLPASAGGKGDKGSIPGSGRSPGGGRGSPLQCSCLESPVERGTWQGMVHGVTKSWTWLSTGRSSLQLLVYGNCHINAKSPSPSVSVRNWRDVRSVRCELPGSRQRL